MIRTAFEMAADAHKTMRRKSGEPYIFIPWPWPRFVLKKLAWVFVLLFVPCCMIRLKILILPWKMLKENLDSEIARIVDGLTKISNVIDVNASQQAENFKKILLTLTDDPRVILIKLADRLA